MPVLIGELEKITGSPSSVTQVMVRAHETRITGSALTTDELVPIPVDRQGRFEVSLRPGKAVLVLVHGGRVGEGERFPLLVEEGLGTIVSAIKLASDRFDDYEIDELESAAADMLASLDRGLVAATRAEVAQEDAEKAAGTAAADAATSAVQKADEKLSGYVTAAEEHAEYAGGSATRAEIAATRAEASGGAGVPVGALGILRARLLSRSTAPVPLIFAGSSTTAGTNVAEGDRWVNKIAEQVTDRPVVFTYESAAENAPFPDGITFINVGRSGRNSTTYIRMEEATTIGGWAPALVMHAVGANDATASWGLPAFVAGSISERVDAIDAASPLPVAHVVLHQHERADVPLQRPWKDYAAELRDIAATRPNVHVLDAASHFELVGVPGDDPLGLLESDVVHVNEAGNAFYSVLIGELLDLPRKPAIASPSEPEPEPEPEPDPEPEQEPVVILADDFDRPDRDNILGDTPTIGPEGIVWEVPVADVGITDGKMTPADGTSKTAMIDTGEADVDLSIDVIYDPATSVAGVVVRALDITNRWGVYFNGGKDEIQVYRMIGGTNSTVASVDYTFTPGEPMMFRIRCDGPVITAWLDDEQVIEHTMTEEENAQSRTWTKIGTRTTAQTAVWDNLVVHNIP